MTIGASPSLGAIRTELGRSGANFNMNDAGVRFFGQAPSTPGSAYTMGTFIGKSSTNTTLFVGTSGGLYGYAAGSFGNISDGYFRGQWIRGIYGIPASQFFVDLDGVLPISFFNGIQFYSGSLDGTRIFSLTSASASLVSIGGGTATRWQWVGVPAEVSLSPYLGQNVFFNMVY